MDILIINFFHPTEKFLKLAQYKNTSFWLGGIKNNNKYFCPGKNNAVFGMGETLKKSTKEL